ncbi:MAG TPA: PilZ domain-containing protein [Terriglobales bacterium]|nr:PilZ domain-containing protein [Terriglobales bacterium]
MRQRRAFFHPNHSLHAQPILIGKGVPRSVSRAFVRLPAWITVDSPHSEEHVAFVRDISPRGIFFYSDFKLTKGKHIDFVLEYLSGTSRVRLHLNGCVVRVEQAAPKSAIGIAVLFDARHDEVPQSRVQAAR